MFLFLPFIAFSQEPVTPLIHFDNVEAANAIITLEKAYNVKISYPNKLIDGKTVSLEEKKRTLNETLDELSSLLNIHFKIINQRYIVVNKAEEETFNYQQLNTVIINEYLTRGISKNMDATYKIQPKQLDILPGLIEADVLVSLQELPGVISPNETATGLSVRGGTPDQNHIIWDGITMYHSGHLFGMISSFNPNITQNITFYNKGTNPRFGERISSVVDISTSNDITEKINMGFGFNGISADAFFETPIIPNKLSVLVAYRKSYENLFETNTFKKMEQKVFQNSSILDNETSEENFHFKDYNVKLNYKLNSNNTLSGSLIHIDNDLLHDYQDFNNNIFYQDYIDTENNGYSLNWNKNWNSNVKQTTKVSFSDYMLQYDFVTEEDNTQLSKFDKENKIRDFDFSTELSLHNTLSLGYQTSFKHVGYSFVETTDSPIVLDQNDSKINTHALFANYSNRQSKSFNFDIGMRANYYRQLNTLRLEPRLLIVKNINDNLKIQASGEIKNQVIYQIDETVYSDLSLENKLWRLSDGKEAPILNSNHLSLGALYHKNGWSFDFDSYYKKVTGISSLPLGFYNEDDTKYLKGEQNIYGLDFYTKKDFKSIKTWISYSINQIDARFDGINNNRYFTASNEIAHAISASISYKTKKLQVALGWKWHTGKPYTLSTVNPNDDDVSLVGVNTERLPNYHRLDLSSVYNFWFSKKSDIKGKVGLSIWNLYNQKNHLSREYTGNNIADDPVVIQDYYSLNLTPNFLFRMYW
ncbi:FecR domain-containing protein [Yeosuana aromativorans]|uniref:FecR domain-containing protein n=1 Tax=Yeosuana aromativorans TaxID=288019 RepID=UPI00166D11C3|nr:FecR domain-containing protein [Yeosuana aromativorans]